MQSVNEVCQLFIPGVHAKSGLFASALKFLEYLPA
jgi:hypothetical protein